MGRPQYMPSSYTRNQRELNAFTSFYKAIVLLCPRQRTSVKRRDSYFSYKPADSRQSSPFYNGRRRKMLPRSGQFRYANSVTDSDAPPLPELTNEIRTAKPAEQNSWLRLVETVPVFAESVPYPGRTHSVLPGTRSPFRTGNLVLDSDGITIDGMVVKTFPPWLTAFPALAVVPQLLFHFMGTIGKRVGIPIAARIVAFLVWMGLIFVPIFLRNRYERIRLPATTLFDWDSLQAIQVDPQLRHLTLVFHSFAVTGAKDKVRPREFLFLNKLDPATIAGIVTTIQEYAPNVIREEPLKKQSIRWQWVGIVLAVVLGLALAAVILLAVLRRRGIP